MTPAWSGLPNMPAAIQWRLGNRQQSEALLEEAETLARRLGQQEGSEAYSATLGDVL